MHTRYFRYKKIEDLQADVDRLGLDITFESNLNAVWNKVKVGDRWIGNSLAVNPMEGCDGTLDGAPDELTFRRWSRFGAGGAKLVWGEATAVRPEGRANPRQLLISDRNLLSFEKLIGVTRGRHREIFGSDDDLLIGIQLTHSGRFSFEKPYIAYHHPQIDSITFLDKKNKVVIPPDFPLVTDDYLKSLEDAFVSAAVSVAKVGFDFVDIKQCHSYLLNELLGARSRHGKYGGRSIEKRTRFIRNVIGRIKEAVGNKVVIASRLSAFDGVPFVKDPFTGVGKPAPHVTPYEYGFGIDRSNPLVEDLSEVLTLIRMLVTRGLSLLSISIGSPYYNMHIGRPYERPPVDAYYAPEHPLVGVYRHFRIVEKIQEEFPSLPIVGTGYSWLRQYFINAAESNLRRHRVTIVGIGRAAIAYPDFVRDLKERGVLAANKVCIGASFCTDLMRFKHNELGQYPSGCVPRDDVYAHIYKEALAKRASAEAEFQLRKVETRGRAEAERLRMNRSSKRKGHE